MQLLLTGKLLDARRDAVILNAAATLAAESNDFQAAIDECNQSIDSGAALLKMKNLVEFSQSFILHPIE
jgi:anthranilate phosphoribosyltransferase